MGLTELEAMRRAERIVGAPAVAKRIALEPALAAIFSNGTIAAAVMVLSAVAAVVVANTDAYYPVQAALHMPLTMGVGGIAFGITVEGFVNDFLMAIFFLVVGIELKYELTVGVLTEARQAALPMLAACGGVICPAVIFSAINALGNGHVEGWAIPVATDIAFALGIMSLMGDKVAPAAKVFFSTLAIADDVIGILIIAVFYGQSPNAFWLAASAAAAGLLLALRKAQVFHARWYLLAGLLLWGCMYGSGIHATLAGVVLAFFLPDGSEIRLGEVAGWMRDRTRELSESYSSDMHVLGQHGFTSTAGLVERVMRQVTPPLQRVERAVAVPVNFLVLPLFAFTNAQLRIVGTDPAALLGNPIAQGVYFGLLLGKPIGIVAVTWALVRLGFAKLPEGADWAQMVGVGIFGGIGFTMCILIAGLSFADGPEQVTAKCAILLASTTASLLGIVFINVSRHIKRKADDARRP
jgi:NhaA family Na+:H+ antiporter